MQLAIEQAQLAAQKNEVPIGAVIVHDGDVIASAYNLKETEQDATAHAELLCLREASTKRENWRLTGCTVYVTLEPCPMCLSALIQARVSRIVYGAADPVMGACGSKVDLSAVHEANPNVEIIGEVLANECRQLIDDFWAKRRNPL